MKKAIFFSFIGVLLIAIIGIITIYIYSTNEMATTQTEAIEIAKDAADLTIIHHADWFHYIENYFVVEGETSEGKNLIVWVPEDSEEEITIQKIEDGLSRKEVTNLLANHLDLSSDKKPKEILKVKLGMVEKAPAYEITYRDQRNRYSIIYIDFYKGNWYRVYNL